LDKYRNDLENLVHERTEQLYATNEELQAFNEDLFYQKEELQTAIDALNNAQNQIIKSEKLASLGVLSARIAHEINNPLNFINGGILGIEDYIKDNLKDHLEYLQPLIDAINEGVSRSSDIVSSLSHYSVQDDMPRTCCEIHSIINNCLVLLQSELKNKVEIIKQYNCFPVNINCNEGMLHQAIFNILSNSMHSIESHGTITILTDIADNELIISISDTGIGMSKSVMEKIFDPFFTTKEQGKGTGLGLSITYKIIQEHNGTLSYQSEIGHGTTATIKLPIIN